MAENERLQNLIEQDGAIKFLFYNEEMDVQDNIKLKIVLNLIDKTRGMTLMEVAEWIERKDKQVEGYITPEIADIEPRNVYMLIPWEDFKTLKQGKLGG